ncbi:hypothetical protein Ddc_15676 [Ditylenchus destructor]|nr:hypothetical protein Ddc_15676 [Ditylenchus destructor]
MFLPCAMISPVTVFDADPCTHHPAFSYQTDSRISSLENQDKISQHIPSHALITSKKVWMPCAWCPSQQRPIFHLYPTKGISTKKFRRSNGFVLGGGGGGGEGWRASWLAAKLIPASRSRLRNPK